MNKMNRIIALILTVVMLIGTLMLEVGAATAVDIIYEKDEEIESVVVVCEGANNLRVVMNIREMVSTALGTEQKSVKIYLKKE